ncbi:MAG: ABC transporter ATP-binding protein [Betaproteobacteria bacterium]|nr:ABC transporter ATP-binding protein [Betaproteobacteria bacterium]NDF69952.1 ABC transporter ATP-binding protein [Betaproteobacteria bacterium]
MTTPAIDIRGLVKTYGSLRALDGVDLTVAPGEFFALLGPNGAGKTTLISILAGLVRPTAGSVRVMGVDVVGDGPEARRQLGVVPQELVFDPFFTVRETLRIQSGYFGLLRNDDWIDELLAALELTDKADTNMRRLSGGMKRRVLVGQALVHRPPVIVLDEPTAGVDVALRQGLWALMRRLNAEGHTIVLTTHYLEEAEELCGRVAMLKQGSLAALAPTQQLLARYAQRQVWLRLSDADRLPAGLASRFTSADGGWLADLADIGALEPLLAAVRQSGAGLEDLELRRADLEQVFLHLTESA